MLPEAAANARAALGPVEPRRLTDRLTALGMMMAPNRPPAEATVWLNEMTRLLGDLPEDILANAIDGLVKTCKFLPTCSEIREKAEVLVGQRRRMVSQLEAMVRYVDSGQTVPDIAPRHEPETQRRQDQPMTPDQVEKWNEIMAKAGALTRYKPDGSRYEVAKDGKTERHRGPPRKPTRQDYIALGVDPSILDAA